MSGLGVHASKHRAVYQQQLSCL